MALYLKGVIFKRFDFIVTNQLEPIKHGIFTRNTLLTKLKAKVSLRFIIK